MRNGDDDDTRSDGVADSLDFSIAYRQCLEHNHTIMMKHDAYLVAQSLPCTVSTAFALFCGEGKSEKKNSGCECEIYECETCRLVICKCDIL